MLDPWIIEEIRKREDERKHDHGRVIELPLQNPHSQDGGDGVPHQDEPERGVVIIDL